MELENDTHTRTEFDKLSEESDVAAVDTQPLEGFYGLDSDHHMMVGESDSHESFMYSEKGLEELRWISKPLREWGDLTKWFKFGPTQDFEFTGDKDYKTCYVLIFQFLQDNANTDIESEYALGMDAASQLSMSLKFVGSGINFGSHASFSVLKKSVHPLKGSYQLSLPLKVEMKRYRHKKTGDIGTSSNVVKVLPNPGVFRPGQADFVVLKGVNYDGPFTFGLPDAEDMVQIKAEKGDELVGVVGLNLGKSVDFKIEASVRSNGNLSFLMRTTENGTVQHFQGSSGPLAHRIV